MQTHTRSIDDLEDLLAAYDPLLEATSLDDGADPLEYLLEEAQREQKRAADAPMEYAVEERLRDCSDFKDLVSVRDDDDDGSHVLCVVDIARRWQQISNES